MVLRFRPIAAAAVTAVCDIARQTASHAVTAVRWCAVAIRERLAGRKYENSLFALGRALYRHGIGDPSTINRIKQLCLQIESEQPFQQRSAKADAVAMRRRETQSLARTALAEELPEAAPIAETSLAKQSWRKWNDDRVRRDWLLHDLRTTDRDERRRLIIGYGVTLVACWMVARILFVGREENPTSHGDQIAAAASPSEKRAKENDAFNAVGSIDSLSSPVMTSVPPPTDSVSSGASKPATNTRLITQPVVSTTEGAKAEAAPPPRRDSAEVGAIRNVAEPPDIAGLIKQLNDSNPAVRRSAAVALGEVGPAARDAVEPLIRHFDDGRVCEQASIAVGKIGSEALPRLETALSDNDRSVRYYAVGALSFIGKDGVNLLIRALDDRDENVASFAVHALGRIGAEAVPAVPRLIERMQHHSDYSSRESAAQALGRIGPPAKTAIEPLLDAMRQDRNRSGNPWKYADALAGIGREALPFLLAELPDDPAAGKSDPYMREEAIRAITKLGDEGRPALPRLAKALSDPAESVGLRAMSGLKSFEFRGAGVDAHVLAPALDSKNAQIREYTISMLVVGGHAAAVIPRLEGAVGDQNGDVRLAAIGALGILGQAAAPSAARLSTLLKNEQAPFAERLASATSLAQIVPEESDDAWAFVVTNLDSRIVPWRVRALQSLPVFGDRVASIRPKLLDFSTDSNDAVRAAAKLVLNGLPKD